MINDEYLPDNDETMKLPSLSFLLQAFVSVCRRFPATMLCAATAVAMLMVVFESNNRQGDDPLVKTWLMAQIGLALCTGLAVFAESRNMPSLPKWALQAGGLALLGVYFFLFDLDARNLEQVQMPRYAGMLAAAHLFVAAAPFLNRNPVADFWEYNKQLFANFVVGAVYTVILFAGLSLAVFAVDELFNLPLTNKIYGHLFVLLAGLFNTSFFLYHFPASFQFTDRERAYNIIFKNLCQYILIPIVGLYFLILYAYSIKILVTWNLPHGWVSSLVLGFSVAGIFTYLVNYLLPDYTDNVIVHTYRRWFWWVLLPMVGLLFVAIGRRISDYGVTEERYFVAHAGVWLLVMCAYFLWSKTDNIKFIPISLGLFILIAVVGPLSAFKVAQRSQTSILRGLLEKNGRFAGAELRPGGAAVPAEDADRILSGLVFLDEQDALDRIAPWFPVALDSIARDSTRHGHYQRASAIALWLNAAPESARAAAAAQRQISVYPLRPGTMAGNIAGYRNFYKVELYGDTHRGEDAKAAFSKDLNALLLLGADGETVADSFDLSKAMRAWLAAAGDQGYYSLPNGAEFVELKGKKSAGRLYIQEAQFDGLKMEMRSLNGLLFVK